MIQCIDPFIGIDGNGESQPGPCLPSCLVRRSPFTIAPQKTDGYCTAEPIKHFSHTHVAGTGDMSHYGNIGILPFNGAPLLNVAPFDRVNETAACGYYTVNPACFHESSKKIWKLRRDEARSFAPRRVDETWPKPFDPERCRRDSWNDPFFDESPSREWSCNAHHDFVGFVLRFGSPEKFIGALNDFFIPPRAPGMERPRRPHAEPPLSEQRDDAPRSLPLPLSTARPSTAPASATPRSRVAPFSVSPPPPPLPRGARPSSRPHLFSRINKPIPMIPRLPRTLRLGFFAFISLVTLPLSAATWHVNGNGDDARDGKTPATAFRSLQKAADLVEPGDTVLIGDGIYTNDNTASESAVLTIKRSGREDAWITYKAAPGAKPDIRPIGWSGILITSSYNIIDGLRVTGGNDGIVFLDALADEKIKEKDGKNYPGSPRFNTNGIFFNGRLNPTDAKPHHLIVRNCIVSKCPGGGITGIEMDYFTVEDNLVFDNAWFMRYGGSGITTLNNWAFDDKPGYHIIIRRNLVWNNKTLVPWSAIGKLSDGNGILLDVTDKKTGAANPTEAAATAAGDPNAASLKPERPIWKNRALIANNVSAYNGGSGIHTFRTAHVDIINNTTYWNGSSVGYAELFANSSSDVVFLNNIIVPRPNGKVTGNSKNTDIRWDYNVYPVEQKIVTGPNDLVADPLFVKIHADLREADFRLQRKSPALKSGTDDIAQPTDITGKKRPVGKGRDRGAYQQ